MTLAACRKCGKPFPTHTPNCPDRVLPPASLQTIAGEEGVGFSRQPSREKEAEAKIMKWKKRLTYVVVIAVGAGFITYLSEGWGNSPPGTGDKIEALTMCQQFVKGRLRSPASADFPWAHAGRVTALGGGQYRIRSYVDAQNAFGAEVRTDFVCTVQRSSGRWQLVNLDMNPR